MNEIYEKVIRKSIIGEAEPKEKVLLNELSLSNSGTAELKASLFDIYDKAVRKSVLLDQEVGQKVVEEEKYLESNEKTEATEINQNINESISLY